MNTIYPMLLGAFLPVASMLGAVPVVAADGPQKAIVLVHGGFVDGSGWKASMTS